MMSLATRTPMQLLAQTGCGIVLGAAGFIALQVDDSVFGSHAIAVGVAMVGLLAAGFWLSIDAEGELRNGIAAARWSDEQVERVRRVTESRWTVGLLFAVTIAGCVLMFPRHRHLRGYGWACLVACQALSRLTMAVKRPKPEGPRTMIWDDMKPISSEHWGGR